MPELSESLETLGRQYSPLFSDLERSLEDQLGPLVWEERSVPSIVTLHDGRTMARAGLIVAHGVPLGLLDYDALNRLLTEVAERHNMTPEGPLHAHRSAGYLMMFSHDRRGGEFTFRTKGTLEAWVDLPMSVVADGEG